MLADKQLFEMPAATTAFDIETAARLRAAIGRLSRRLRTTAAAREAGLTPTATSVLLNVDRNGPVRLAELAESELINPTLLSRVVASLLDAGLLERASDEGDRRAAWVAATRAGHKLAERMRRERTDAVNAAMGGLSSEDSGRIERALPALEALAAELKGRRP
jgi:DNA-binding MarR family transcriptional regulator